MKQEIKKYTFNKNLSLQIEVVDLSTLMNVYRDLIFVPHRTNFYHIFLFDNCRPKHLVDFKPVAVQPHSLLFINKDNVHLFDKRTEYKGKVLIFTDEFFCLSDSDKNYLHNSIVFNNLFGITHLRLGTSYPMFVKQFNEINDALISPFNATRHIIVKNLLHNLLLYSEQKKRENGFTEFRKGAEYDYTMLFNDLLDQRFHHLKSVSAYAALLHVTEKRLNHATTAILGKTPKQMIDERVLLEAKRLLTHTAQSIKEIAFAVGYEEPTNFIKYFRKHTSHTPVEFRALYERP